MTDTDFIKAMQQGLPPINPPSTTGLVVTEYSVAEADGEAATRIAAAAPELLKALTKAVRETEGFLFEAWLVRVCPSGDVEAVHRQWLASSDYCEFIDEWREQIDAIDKATGEQACAS